MTQIALVDGSYQARSLIASAQRCVNLYPEVNQLNKTLFYPQQMTNTVITHYLTPGLRQLVKVGTGPIRGLYTASTGLLYCVSGSGLYSLNTSFVATLRGSIPYLTTPVSMADNGATLVLVDGTANGYQVDLTTQAFSAISSPAFYGADRVDFMDTYMVFNKPGTSQFYSTTSNLVAFDPLYFAAKTAKPDWLVAPVVMHDELWLIGEQTTEVWYLSGGTDFPFSKTPGAFMQHGCMAKYSIAVQNLQIFWLSQNAQGERVVLKGEGYNVERISTHAIEADFAKYTVASDAVGFIYQQQGHQFYVLSFPTAKKTWVYDTQTDLWHERTFLQPTGAEDRIRANCSATYAGLNVVGDWQDGRIYALDPDVYTDDGSPIERIRSFPTLQNEMRRTTYVFFIADMEPAGSTDAGPVRPQYQIDAAGNLVLTTVNGNQYATILNQAALNADGSTIAIGLRWSDTGGADWSEIVYQSLGFQGEFQTNVQWSRLGMGRRRVFELRWTAPVKTALNGAYIDVVKASE